MRRHRRRRERCFTLVEALVALTVLSIAVTAIVTPVTVAIDHKTRAAKQTLAVLLAEQLIEDCLSQDTFSFDEPAVLGPSGDETTRTRYDEVSDYHYVFEMPSRFGPIFGGGVQGSDYPPNFARWMWLQPVYLPGQRDFYPPDFVMLTVRVWDGTEELVVLRRLVRNDDHWYP